MINNTDANVAKILIVDDKSENLIAMKKTLAPLKIEIITALSGNEALKLMLEHDFAMVLLDVMMPDMSGFEVADLMHQDNITKYIPIIFITAINKTEQYYIRGMEAGAIDYLYKPIDPIVLLSKVRVFIDLYTIRNKLEKTIVQLNDFKTQLQENNINLKKLSEEDMLTKTANRRHFEAECIRLMDLCKNTDKFLSLLYIDVDNFKSINDKFGHRTGDQVLIILADRLKNLSSATEIKKDELHLDIIARLGGDEFAIVGRGLNKPNQTEKLARLVLQAIDRDFDCDGKIIKVSISIGVANYPEAGNTLTELMRAADVALYSSKAAGKNTFTLHNSQSI